MTAYSPIQGHYHSHRITLEGLDQDAFTRSLTSARVEMNPHQVEASLFALRSPLSKGVLLADEVGLGKTIEAGLVMAQKWAEQKRRILLIVPASLRKQWEQELREKFSLPATILEAATYKELRKQGQAKPFRDAHGIVICSYEFAARCADELATIKWDLVVFDEAHRLRNVYKQGGSKRAKELKEALKEPFKVLLTATPLQNSLMELFGIVSIIDDNHFGGEDAFKTLYTGAGVTTASLDMLRQRLATICCRTLRRQVQEAGHINFTRRNPVIFDFEPPSREVELYEKVSEFLQRKDTISYGDRANQLVILQVRKILGSSTFAVAGYLRSLIERLERHGVVDETVSEDIDTIDEIGEELDEDGTEPEPVDPERLAAELLELRSFLDLAISIGQNAKGEKLISQLPHVLDAIVQKGGRRKAVIFTESVRTQNYLSELLSTNGYDRQIALLNGSNSDPVSKALYQSWQDRHAGTDKVSGSRTADMKAAVVDAFKGDDKTILIATESGAEGINLQFCSLVINFDLPWNPQRVEQRIGRCHRYGQKIDVTVVNMLNRKNQAEQRIYELLDQKFKLFSGVFGSSDEVLGTIERGVDFEQRVLGIVQSCRTEEEVAREFDALTASLQDRIDADMQSARAKVLEHLDQDVVARLKGRKGELDNAVDDFTRRLAVIARAELPAAHFYSETLTRFDYRGQTFTTRWPEADDHDWQFFRLSEGNLASELVEKAKARDHGVTVSSLRFLPAAYAFPGQLADVKNLTGQSGWLRVSKAQIKARGTVREELMISCLTDGGVEVSPETADRMFMVPARSDGVAAAATPREIDRLELEHFGAFSERMKRQNFRWLEEEEARLDNYAKDIEIELDARIKELDSEIKALRKERRSPDLSMDDKLSLSRTVKKLEGEMDDLKLSKHERRRDVRKQVEDMLDDVAESLSRQPVIQPLFMVRWSIE
ncbi:SNF2-related protein [Mesorhizobium sp. BR1-1-15]|uniref:SNF2-related protein n=1 Tax=Mesorhizobium sp. BR1-1-15 TaxID=2876654 RepID=UPI001CCEDC60|nr:SNF2-related protein [Mesorhizobium sp. BR1-1-15]MBZ9952876.1 DEAD/DEAH box helicase family protein [Mesorhizobium sp. BR1-1-15]